MQQNYLKSKIRVGSIRSKLNYDALERVFHSDDIPSSIKQRVDEVHAMKLKRCPQSVWRKSTFLLKAENEPTIPQKPQRSPTKAQMLTDAQPTVSKNRLVTRNGETTLLKSGSLNICFFAAPEQKWGTTDTRDLFTYQQMVAAAGTEPEWNRSTVFLKTPDSQVLGKLRAKTADQLRVSDYMNPTQREEQRMHAMRKYKDQVRQNQREQLRREKVEKRLSTNYRVTTLKMKPMSAADKENRDAETKSEVESKFSTEALAAYLSEIELNDAKFHEDSSINQRLIELMMTKRNKMYTTRQLLKIQERRKYDIVREYFHNGAFEMARGGWSCCMNGNRHSQGCQVKLINTATWQTVGV